MVQDQQALLAEGLSWRLVALTVYRFSLTCARVKKQRCTQHIGKEKLGIGSHTGGSWGSCPSVPNGELRLWQRQIDQRERTTRDPDTCG